MAVVLIVDDEEAMCNALQMLLSFRGFDCEIAHNGLEALTIVRERKIDVVLLDVMMPVMNGFELCAAIKQDPRLKSIPVIMITALSDKKDRIQGIEAGADDFINKPIDHSEVLARIRMLLKVKQSHDTLNQAFEDILGLVRYGEETLGSSPSAEFDFMVKIDGIVDRIIRKESDMLHKPEGVIVGYLAERDNWTWFHYESIYRRLVRARINGAIRQSLTPLWKEDAQLGYVNQESIDRPEYALLFEELRERNLQIRNMVYYLSRDLCIIMINHGREVGQYDAAILQGMVTMSDSLRSLARQVQETENAFGYMVRSLARASEVNDEDTGRHILRVGEYAGFIAEKLGLSGKVAAMIREQAPLHDVGKIYIPPAVLKKPGNLTPDEMTMIRQHPLYGARIIGDHPRLEIGRNIALCHHERWDGSGYPHGLAGENIPVEGRIVALADQYDALRNKRVYKEAFDHQKTYDILTRGDGRTMPSHFDPDLLAIFRKHEKEFEDIYDNRMKD